MTQFSPTGSSFGMTLVDHTPCRYITNPRNIFILVKRHEITKKIPFFVFFLILNVGKELDFNEVVCNEDPWEVSNKLRNGSTFVWPFSLNIPTSRCVFPYLSSTTKLFFEIQSYHLIYFGSDPNHINKLEY